MSDPSGHGLFDTAASVALFQGFSGYALAGSDPVGQVYTTGGAIAPGIGFALVNASSACAMTLAAGSTDGQVLMVKALGIGPVTLAANLDTVSTTYSMSAGTCLTLVWSAGFSTWLLT